MEAHDGSPWTEGQRNVPTPGFGAIFFCVYGLARNALYHRGCLSE